MACLSPRLFQTELQCMEHTAVEYLVSQPTPVVNTFKNLNRNTLHRILNQLASIHDIHVQSLFLALLTDYIACDCREMDIGVSGEWLGSLNKNTIQLIHKLSNAWRYNLSSAHQVLTIEQFRAHVSILKRCAARLSDFNISSSFMFEDVLQIGQALVDTEPVRRKQLPSDVTDMDFTYTVKPKTPKVSRKRPHAQTNCWQPDPKPKLSVTNTDVKESRLMPSSLAGLNSSSCSTLKRLLECSAPETPLCRKPMWDITSDSEDDSWLMESPLGISRKLQVSPPIPQQNEVVQQSKAFQEVKNGAGNIEIKSPIVNEVISISDDSSCSVCITPKKTSLTGMRTASCSNPNFKPLFSADQENQAFSQDVVNVSSANAAKLLCPTPLTELTNKVSLICNSETTPYLYKVPTPIKDNAYVKLNTDKSNSTDAFIKETVKPIPVNDALPSSDKPQLIYDKCSPNWSLGKKNFQRKNLTPEDVNKFKTGNVLNAFALMMSQAKKLA